jgi:hypothetical protein
MVNIDTVYQRVLAFANKEQRGYITPQEFNLFANQAQLEIFEQYFYDLNQGARIPGNDTEFSDILSLLGEKISVFEIERDNAWVRSVMATVTNGFTLPPDMYRIGTVRVGTAPVEMLTSKQFNAAILSPLTTPTAVRPIGYMVNAGFTNATIGKIIVAVSGTTYALPADYDINLSYIKIPTKAVWDYFVVNEKALYNTNSSVDFELHPSEESELVYKILKFAGVSMAKPDIMRAGQGMEMAQTQQEKQ